MPQFGYVENLLTILAGRCNAEFDFSLLELIDKING